MKQTSIYALGASVVVCALAYFGVPLALGAHPWWAFDVALYAVVPGVLLAVGLARLQTAGWVLAWAELAFATGVAFWGKRRFVASSGDDVFAGQMWFYGWIALCACAIAALALTALRLRRGAE